jgi:hypothetical protein
MVESLCKSSTVLATTKALRTCLSCERPAPEPNGTRVGSPRLAPYLMKAPSVHSLFDTCMSFSWCGGLNRLALQWGTLSTPSW